MTEQDYLRRSVGKDPRHCHVERLGNLRLPGELSEAVSIKHRYPDRLVVDLAQSGGDMITDFIDNILAILIASAKARAVLEDEGIAGAGAEYLPIVLRDKRGKALQEPFFIVNVLRHLDCFDWERSVYRVFNNSPGQLSTVKTLHIKPEAIPADAKLFRLGELRRELIIRADLLDRLKREGCEGISVLSMGQRRLI